MLLNLFGVSEASIKSMTLPPKKTTTTKYVCLFSNISIFCEVGEGFLDSDLYQMYSVAENIISRILSRFIVRLIENLQQISNSGVQSLSLLALHLPKLLELRGGSARSGPFRSFHAFRGHSLKPLLHLEICCLANFMVRKRFLRILKGNRNWRRFESPGEG